MKSITLQVPVKGLSLKFLVKGRLPAQVVLVLPDDVDVTETQVNELLLGSLTEKKAIQALTHSPISPIRNDQGFPPRKLTEEAIIQIIKENEGVVTIRDQFSGWNIYDEIAARLGVSIEARRRLTPGTGEPAWRPEVGFARKNLEQRGIIKPTDESGRGVWALKENFYRK